MALHFDLGTRGRRMDVDSVSWSLASGSSRPFEPGALLDVRLFSHIGYLAPRCQAQTLVDRTKVKLRHAFGRRKAWIRRPRRGHSPGGHIRAAPEDRSACVHPWSSYGFRC